MKYDSISHNQLQITKFYKILHNVKYFCDAVFMQYLHVTLSSHYHISLVDMIPINCTSIVIGWGNYHHT